MNLPSLQELLKANETVWKKYRSGLIFGISATLIVWFLEGLFNLKIPRAVPIFGGAWPHFIPEWLLLFYIGCLTAEIKNALIPTELIALITYVLTAFSVLLIIFGFSTSGFIFMLVFSSPFLFGYAIKRISYWREAGKRKTRP